MLGHYRGGGAAYVDAGDRAFAQKTVVLKNLGEGRFVEWEGTGDLGKLRMSARGTAVADLDGDGALDLVVVDIDGPLRVLRNALPAGHWIAVEPRPRADGSGTVLETRVGVTARGRTQWQTYRVSPSYASGSLVPLHFGIGPATAADVEVRWSGGERQAFAAVAADRAYALRPGGTLESMIAAGAKPQP